MAAEPSPAFVCTGSVILDDIVYPDGRTEMAVLGGGGTHAAAGMNAWDVRPGVLGTIGRDLPEAIAARLERMCDLRGVVYLDMPQLRAWQIFEWNGRRTEIFRDDAMVPYLDVPSAQDATPVYDDAEAIHVLREAAGLREYRARYPKATLLWEPEQAYMMAKNHDEFVAALTVADIVTPNLLEASLVYGENDPVVLLRRMLEGGAAVAVLRLGEAGSIAGVRGDPRFLRVPAVPAREIVDVTGAGNTYGGAFLVGWHETHDLASAVAYGAVAASFCLEQLGVLDYTHELDSLRAERLTWALTNLQWGD
ncbi:MAG: PfkB family carbohydrate kinase [Anaerolineae bacterium]